MNFLTKTYIFVATALTAILTVSAAVPPAKSAAKPKITVERPDMEQIRREVTDPSSRYYYPRLMANYERNETIMTHDDFRHLYLGAIFQEDYDPYRKSEFDAKVEELYYRTDHTRAELDTIITYAEHALEDDPFDLQQMNYLIYALNGRQKYNRAKIYQYKLNHILGAILSTGTGTDQENAWIVIDPKHEYNIINFHNSIAENVEYQQPYYEYIKLKANPADNASSADKKPEGYYFNIRYILQEYYRKHPEQLQQQ